jgi:hypothetical protein
MDIIFPSYSRSFKRFELGQTPNADAAFSELDSELARLEEERRRQAEADAAAAAAAAAAAQGTTITQTTEPASGAAAQLQRMAPAVPAFTGQFSKEKSPLIARIKKAFFVGPPAPPQPGAPAGTGEKIDWPVYIGAVVVLAAAIGGVTYYMRKRKG